MYMDIGLCLGSGLGIYPVYQAWLAAARTILGCAGAGNTGFESVYRAVDFVDIYTPTSKC